MVKLKKLPKQDRPREKLEKYGVKNLTNSELLALILRTGTKKQNVVELCQKMLDMYNIKNLSQTTLNQLIEFHGIKKAKAAQVLATFELARRLASYSDHYETIKSPFDVHKLLMPELRFLKKEKFIGLYLNSENKLVHEETISIGLFNQSLVGIREIFSPAITQGASHFILVHNHPSGNPRPSKEDIEVTNKIKKAAKLLNIEFTDHVIIGNKQFFSFKREELL